MRYEDFVLFPFDALRIALFPKKCIFCDEIIDEDMDVCPDCENQLEVINPIKRCVFCGNERDGCTCKIRVHYFQRAVCLYKNEGLAKSGVYKYKLNKKNHYATFFARKLAERIEKEFAGIKFSAIVPVPTSIKSKLQHGFDHTALLAKNVSYLLGVRYRGDILKTYSSYKPQHKSTYAERKVNARNKFYFKKPLKCKNVLLIDDIKTSGATLDACARQLLLAGVHNVYCATLLSTSLKKKEENKE